ncbi:unnamed protein product [Echinostoma caproni]|uniref:Secreted protein n=1 Tax=Echinostoma caproni TaxID=27848 RepID=A0A183A8Z4_9TREM|nr:unnamed protein product [Echinostoma caproni]
MMFNSKATLMLVVTQMILLHSTVCIVDARSITVPEDNINSVVDEQLRYPFVAEIDVPFRSAYSEAAKRAVRLMRLG